MQLRRIALIPLIALLLLMQFCEPITATVIFPFVFQLVNETGVTKGNEDKTGYYAGIIVRSSSSSSSSLPYDQLDKNRRFSSSKLCSSYNGGDYRTRLAANQSY